MLFGSFPLELVSNIGTISLQVFDTVKPTIIQPLSKRPPIGFQYQLSLYADQKYYIILQGEHSEIVSTFIKLPFVIKIFVLSIFSGRFIQVLL